MTIREILKMGDARLLRIAQPVEPELFGSAKLQALIADLFDTMAHANGAGLAAPQIGVDLQLVIFGSDQPNPRYPDAPVVPRTILINPVITLLTGDGQELDFSDPDAMAQARPEDVECGWEGCLSVPGLRGVVPRFKRLRYEGFDPDGQPIAREADGFHARVVQHECDHLWGVLYPMRIRDFSQFGYTEVLFPNLQDQADD
ncbi:MAG: peptide deformylase [Burkholderiaceae bacterium]